MSALATTANDPAGSAPVAVGVAVVSVAAGGGSSAVTVGATVFVGVGGAGAADVPAADSESALPVHAASTTATAPTERAMEGALKDMELLGVTWYRH
jgi:hypothetical protein